MSDDHPVVLQQASYRVRMADVDAAGVLYFASPLRWQEMLVSEWFFRSGHRLSEQFAQGTGCPCVEAHANYHLPLRLDDELALRLMVERVGRTSFGLRMEGRTSAGEVGVEVRTTNVWTAFGDGGAMQSTPLPPWLRAELTTGGERSDRLDEPAAWSLLRSDE